MKVTREWEDEIDAIAPRSWWKRLLRIVVAVTAISSLIYASGIHQYLFLRRTPDAVQQSVLPSKVQAQVVVVPVVVHILSGPAGSGRTDSDVYRLVENANNIWAQANILFEIQDVQHEQVSAEDLVEFERQPFVYIQQSKSYRPDQVNVYLIRTLHGVNGLAYGGTRAVSVAEYTSTLDFRTLAHEFGHILGLDHVRSSRRLMSSGASGVELTEEEVITARDHVLQYPE